MAPGEVSSAYQGSPQALRWVVLTATGVVLTRPGRLYYVRLAGTGALSAVLRDSVDATGPLLLGLATGAAGADDWPRIPVSLNFLHGLHATITGAGTLSLGWNPD